GGYLYDVKVYCGQERNDNEELTDPTIVVLDLVRNLLNKGRTVGVDNYYTSVELAQENVIEKKLKKGDCIVEESNTGIYVEKWKDKRDVMILNTKHIPEMVTVRKRSGEIEKPKNILEYNRHKSYIQVDISDQMKAYNNSLRRGVKWYRKLAIKLIVEAGLVNAYWLYQKVTQNKMSITKFHEEVVI
ncbi:hypothetical protein ILUMI_03381, partial [Ignelater luminosus]